MERRIAPRLRVSVPVGVEVNGLCAEGKICDISISGARIESSNMAPEPGSHVSVSFVLAPDLPAFEVPAKVVRETEGGGFAVQFDRFEPRLEDVLGMLLGRAATVLEPIEPPEVVRTMRISQLADEDVLSVDPETPLSEVAAQLEGRAKPCAIVWKDGPLGVITPTDVLAAPPGVTAASAMSSPARVVHCDERLAGVLADPDRLRGRYLPVVDGFGELCGIVEQTELLLFCADLLVRNDAG